MRIKRGVTSHRRHRRILKQADVEPLDEDYWAANNPGTIAKRNADRIRNSGLAIYIECGDKVS